MSVPNNESFNLQNIVDELDGGETSLQDCFTNANASGFDSTYNNDTYAPANSMLRFRNYKNENLKAYFNGITSQGYANDISYVNSSDPKPRVSCTVVLSDLTDRTILELTDVVIIYYSAALQNICMGWIGRPYGYRAYSLDGLIETDIEYTITVNYSSRAYGFTISGSDGTGSNNSWSDQDNSIVTGYLDLHLGTHNSLRSSSKFKGWLYDVIVYDDYSKDYSVLDPSTSTTDYTATDITLTDCP